MRRGVVLRAYPDEDQNAFMRGQFGAVRFLWNHMLALRLRYHKTHKKWVSPSRLKKHLARMKARPAWAWLRRYDSIALQQVLQNLQKTLTNAFEHGMGFPVFKSRRGKQTSFHCTGRMRLVSSPSQNLRGDAELWIPKMKTPLRVRMSREIPDTWVLKSVTLKRLPTGLYYASLGFDDGAVPPAKPTILTADAVNAGDLGVNRLLTMSDGQEVENPRFERKHEKRIKTAAKKMARKQKGSRNREKAAIKLAKAYKAEADARADHAHKLSRRLVDENQAIGFEDLCVKGMMKGGRGLARSLQGAAFGQLKTLTAYKAERAGKHFVQIDRFFPSSKRCNACGHVHKDLGRGTQVWTCPHCGEVLLRDVNAALNIKQETIRILRTAGLVVRGTTARTLVEAA